MKPLSAKQIALLEYVEQHPGITAAEVHRAIGKKNRKHSGTYARIARLKARGLLKEGAVTLTSCARWPSNNGVGREVLFSNAIGLYRVAHLEAP
jgi:hypothetical protein